MASSTVILKAAGLITSPNELDRAEGSLTLASNIIVRRDGILEQRRGFKIYGNETDSSVKQLTSYRDTILRHYGSSLQYDSDGAGDFVDYTSSVVETQAGLRIKFAESNGNLYFTTADGIKKLSAKTTTQLSEIEPESAGAVKATDISGKIDFEQNNQTGFLTQDSVVAYRMTWTKKDNNGNLLQGTPSQRAIVYNPLTYLMLKDFSAVLGTLDDLVNTPSTTARIDDGDYYTLTLPATADASQLRTNLISLAAKIDNNILIANQTTAPLVISTAVISAGICTITFSAGDATTFWNAGAAVYLAGFAPVSGTVNGAQLLTTVTSTTATFNTAATGVVTLTSATINSNEFRALAQPDEPFIPATNDDLVQLQDYLDEMIQLLQEEPVTIIAAGTDQDSIADLDITTTTTVELTFSIPEIVATDSNYFYQIYRSAVFPATGASSLEDIFPDDELQLVYEDYPTVSQLEAGQITIQDITPDDFRGENLYTNGTDEGILQGNDEPPFAKDITRYRNSLFYANTRTKQRLALNLLGVQQMITDYDDNITPKITISNGTTTNTYQFVTGQQEETDVTTVADVADSLNGKAFKISSTKNNYAFYFKTSGGANTPPTVPDHTLIRVDIATGATNTQVADALFAEAILLIDDFEIEQLSNVLTFIDNDFGEVEDADDIDTGFTIATMQQGQGERVQAEISEFTVIAASLYASSGTADYITINTALNQQQYLLPFIVGTATAPVVSGKIIIPVPLTGSETNAQVAQAIADLLPTTQFLCEVNSNILTATNLRAGECTDAQEFVTNVGFLVETIQEGAMDVLLSTLASPARAVEQTALSLVHVINSNNGESIYAYYLSSVFDVPGKMNLESRTLSDLDEFYVVANNDNTGASFSPIISPEIQITNIATGTSTVVITTADPHGLDNREEVILAATDSEPSIDGIYEITYISPTTFSVGAFVSISGSTGSVSRTSVTLASENEEKVNRVYYSKFQEPEAVPIVNYFDVGASDKAILRILALRDSLFVFKQDGLYRISGDSAPFQLELFDNSFITIAPDSNDVCNNVIYSWTTQGIQGLTEGGGGIISSKIDNIILKTQTFTNFKTATWGVGYESDNSYTVYTVVNRSDTTAQIAYRYCTLTETWTTFDKSNTCGIVNDFDDKLYMGCSDVDFIEQERKMFDRTDYADREYDLTLGSGAILNNTMILPTVDDVEIGDVVVQDQTLTVYDFNMLLEKLSIDTGINDDTYVDDLEMVAGDSPRNKIIALAAKLDDGGLEFTNYSDFVASLTGTITNISTDNPTIITDSSHGLISNRKIRITGSDSIPDIDGEYTVTVLDDNTFTIPTIVNTAGTTGTWETIDSDFEDIQAGFNKIITTLNVDNVVNFANYVTIDNTTIQESIVIAINTITKRITLNLALEYVVGEITLYKAIASTFIYSPNTMGDPVSLKHMGDSQVYFETRTLTGGILSFATDLLPEFIDIEFNLDGNGIFGHSNFGTGFFGGTSNSAPFRTYIPRQCQRCRFIVVKFQHKTAREDYRILGISITANSQTASPRAYR
jgi:hypothetical protein